MSSRVWHSCSFQCTKFIAILSVCTIIGGFTLPGVLQYALDLGIRSAVVWKPDSPSPVDARFRGTNSTVGAQDILKVWLFNITNVEDIRLGKKPVLEEIGPFVYRKFKIKVNAWWDREGRVATKEYDYHVPVPELSGADLNSTIVTLNMPLIGVVESIHSAFGPLYQRLLDLLVSVIARWKDGHVNGLFTQRTAGELIWGYEDLLLQRLSGLLPRGMIKTTLVQLLHNMTGPEEAMALQATLFDTGLKDIRNVWNTLSDGGFTEATCWNNCTERVRGSDGTQFRPGLKRGDRLTVWVPPLYRAEDLVFLQDMEWGGVKFLRFWPDPAALEPNECHYQYVRGLMNLTVPKAVGINGRQGDGTGPPIYVSQPHFCLCDPALAEAVEGLSCNMSRHVTYADVEPITGIPMRGHTATMVSSEITLAARMHVEPQLAKNANRSTVLPIFWMEEDQYACDADLAAFKDTVYRALNVKHYIKHYMATGGGAVLAASLLVMVVLLIRGDEEDEEEQDREREERAQREREARARKPAGAGEAGPRARGGPGWRAGEAGPVLPASTPSGTSTVLADKSEVADGLEQPLLQGDDAA